jgi:hypothetical protein
LAAFAASKRKNASVRSIVAPQVSPAQRRRIRPLGDDEPARTCANLREPARTCAHLRERAIDSLEEL